MKNVLMYYYNMSPEDIHQKDDVYFFKINEDRYYLFPVYRTNEELKAIFEINRELISKNFFVHHIILNKENNILVQYNNLNYVLLKVFLKFNKQIDIKDLNYLHAKTLLQKTDNPLNKSNWGLLWEKKNDYLEYQISQFGINHPVIVEYFAYYIGLAENAILYAKNTVLEVRPNHLDNLVICHRRITNETTLFDLFNSLDFIMDHKVRDIAEYIKFKFFYNKVDLWEEIHSYFNQNDMSLYGIRMFYARLLYPTYFFDKYDQILDGNAHEKDLVHIVELQEEYEEFLADIYTFLNTMYNIPEVEWIMKK